MLDCEKAYNGDLLKLTHPNRRGAHDDYVKSLEYGLHASLSKQTRGTVKLGPKIRDIEELEYIDWMAYPPGVWPGERSEGRQRERPGEGT